MGHEKHTAAVFAPVLFLTVTIEVTSSGSDEVHFHPGGQGFWISRMLRHLDERPLLCGPVGGESGHVIRGLIGQFAMDASMIQAADASPVVLNDRRSGERVAMAETPSIVLERHEMDDLYGRFLDRALASDLCVVTGVVDQILPIDFYERLGHDLASSEVRVVADLHGDELGAFLEGGAIDILKVSDEDLLDDGILKERNADLRTSVEAIHSLTDAGARNVVLSRQAEPALARFGDTWFEARAPDLEPADQRGAGDSMTAGLTAALRQGLPPEETMRLACAAGAANVTRRGLGSADSSLVPGLTEKVRVHELNPIPV